MDQLPLDEFNFSVFNLNLKNEWPRRLLHIPSMTSSAVYFTFRQ